MNCILEEFNDVSQLNAYTKDKWATAVDKFERKLQPAEDLVAGKLRNIINRKKSNTTEVSKSDIVICTNNFTKHFFFVIAYSRIHSLSGNNRKTQDIRSTQG